MLVVSATASDNVAVTGVEFQIDGVTIGSIDTSAPYAVTVDTSLYTSGQHVLRARASDAAGNVSAWSTALVQFGGSVSQPSGFTRNEAWITGLSRATAFAQAADGRIFVAQQDGAIRVIKNGVLLPTPFATVTVDSTGERGLIGIALHPDFASNGYVYIYATRTDGGAHNRISRFTAAGDVAASGSEIALVDLPTLSSATNHNGGGMHFGSDGKLYVGVGENANASLAQNLASPLGKLLRFNEDGTIPTDNPYYATQSGLARAVWASGLRNPFSFAVQPGTGRIHINDVGQNTWEEINLGVAGANYGWPGSEGPSNVGAGITGRCSPTGTATPTRPARARAASSRALRSPAAPSIRRTARSRPATATSTTSPISSASSSAGSTAPMAMRRTRSPGSRALRSTCWWASTARSTC